MLLQSNVFHDIYIMIKNIYIYWGQAFNKAPEIVKACLLSWKLKNPTWNIIEIDDGNIHDYIHIEKEIADIHQRQITKTSYSDIVRIFLLEKFGGCWCDATVFCNKCLDDWLPQNIHSGFFAFDRPDSDRLLSSWFLYADKDNYIVKMWKQKVIQYWKNHDKMHAYFWFHYLFNDLCTSDTRYRQMWDSTTKLPATGPHRHDTRDAPMYKLSYKYEINKDMMKYVSDSINLEHLRLIHIGKCGGTSVIKQFRLREYHLCRDYANDEKYIVWIRNPLHRFVSAFYFSHALIHLRTDDLDIHQLTLDNCLAPARIAHKMRNQNTFSERYDYLINYFQTPNHLAESITCKDEEKKKLALELMHSELEHIYKGIGWYLYNGEFVENNHDRIIFVGSIENMDHDMSRLGNLLNIQITGRTRIRENKHKHDISLSERAIENLMDFYKETDYRALEVLLKYHLITDELFHSYRMY